MFYTSHKNGSALTGIMRVTLKIYCKYSECPSSVKSNKITQKIYKVQFWDVYLVALRAYSCHLVHSVIKMDHRYKLHTQAKNYNYELAKTPNKINKATRVEFCPIYNNILCFISFYRWRISTDFSVVFTDKGHLSHDDTCGQNILREWVT
jgi:hypothetical protein